MKRASRTLQQAEIAWMEYRDILDSTGVLNYFGHEKRFITEVERAFKHAFVTSTHVSYINSLNNGNRQMNKDLGQEPKRKKKLRTEHQKKHEAIKVRNYLRLTGRPTLLSEIVDHMNQNQETWNPKSASGFMKEVMQIEPEVTKVERGVFAWRKP